MMGHRHGLQSQECDGVPLYRIYLLQILYNLWTFKHFNSCIGIDEIWYLKLSSCPLPQLVPIDRSSCTTYHAMGQTEGTQLFSNRANKGRTFVAPHFQWFHLFIVRSGIGLTSSAGHVSYQCHGCCCANTKWFQRNGPQGFSIVRICVRRTVCFQQVFNNIIGFKHFCSRILINEVGDRSSPRPFIQFVTEGSCSRTRTRTIFYC
mmetsp:Transcript_42880/g.63622  ORF Transcript_42880/g.63622 Transcript_42880/m.63622 type:complete len:205 (-) Transcript_42880:55-669(-)